MRPTPTTKQRSVSCSVASACALVGALILGPTGCGARTGLDVLGAIDGLAPSSDAGAESAAPVALKCTPTTAPGTTAWQTTLPGAETFEGPLAADSSGTTYFIGTASTFPTTYTLVALDSCGRQLWQNDGVATDFIEQGQHSLMVSGDQVIVQWGTVDSFDRATGAQLWSVNLSTFAGENLQGDGNSEVAPIVAARDGTSFIAFESSTQAQIVAITSAGTPSTVTKLQPSGDLSAFIIDGKGHLAVLWNSALQGAFVNAFSTSGTPIFSASFVCMAGFLGPLASGNSFIVMQSGPCVLSLAGAPGFSPLPSDEGTDDYAAILVDGHDNLYVNATDARVYSFDSSGNERWSNLSTQYVVGGPLLASGNQLIVARADLSANPTNGITIEALDTTSGSVLWSQSEAATVQFGVLNLLLTPAQQLVFSTGNVVTAVAAGQTPDESAEWPTINGGIDQRRAALGQ